MTTFWQADIERRVQRLEEAANMAAGEFDQLTSDVSALGAAEQAAATRVTALEAVAAQVPTLQAEIDKLKAANPDIAAQLASIEAITASMASLAP